jgi:hypothetical protein
METLPADHSNSVPAIGRRGRLCATVVAVLAIVFVAAAAGFVGFISQLHGAETRPSRTADGIVVRFLTGV